MVKEFFRRQIRQSKPGQVIVLSFLALILVGTILLSLPFVTTSGRSIGLLNAWFTATSAVCVTGLVVVDTGTTFNFIGTAIVLCLIQAGGLGLMTLASLLFMIVRRRISLRERLIIQETFNTDALHGAVRLVRTALIVTFTLEAAVAILLLFRLIPLLGLRNGLLHSVFLAISSFCNAGFDSFGAYQSLTGFVTDPYINFVIMASIVLGGLGFAVVAEIATKRRFMAFRVHTRVVLAMTAALIVVGALFFALVEWNNPATLAGGDLNAGQKLMASLFQSVTLRTAGFNTIDQNGLSPASKLMSMILMFIGGSPASTAGGIKTTTFAVVILAAWSVIRGRRDINLFERRVSISAIRRAAAITVLGLALVLAVTMGLCLLEQTRHPGITFEQLMFEVFSAFGTVGVSCGITPELHPLSKALLSLTMFCGRVGPLTLSIALASRGRTDKGIRLPEGRLMVG